MLTLLLTAVLTAVAPLQDGRTPPTADEIKAAITTLSDAFTKGKSADRVEALQKTAHVVDAKVIEWVAKGLKDDAPEVLEAAIESLRFMQHPDALDALADELKRDKKLEKMPETLAKLYKAIAQHKNPRSITLLASVSLTSADYRVIDACILGLGNIRDKQSVEQLIGLMRTAGRHKTQQYMPNFRMALMVLTGVDQGVSQDTWMSWWNDHKGDFSVPATAPPLPKEMQLKWDYFWGNPVERPRAKKRGERGDDPEGGGGKQ